MPRLDTVKKALSDSDIGMTGMPEASLARELGLCYACFAVVANWSAGRGGGAITMAEINANLKSGMTYVRRLLVHYTRLPGTESGG